MITCKPASPAAAIPVVVPVKPARAGTAAARLRVLMVVESAGGGTGRHVLDLSEGLLARGCDVHLLYSDGRTDRMFLDRLVGLPRLRRKVVPMRTGIHPSDLSVIRAVRRYLNAHGPFDLVHGHSSKGGAIARLAAMGMTVPVVYTLHGLIMMDPALPRARRVFYQCIELALSLRTRRIIAVSPEEARAAVRCGFGASRVALVPNGITPLVTLPRDTARRVMGVDDDALVVGFVGRLVEQKAPDVLVRAFATVARAIPRARLAVVGAGPLDAPLRDLAARLGVAGKIRWLGERPATDVLRGFDVFALASRKEGLPYVVLEAMSAGLPVVATSSAGVEILVEPGANGDVVAPNDPTALAAALLALAADPDLIRRCGEASHRKVAGFSLDTMVDGTLATYLAALRPLMRRATVDEDAEERLALPM